MEELLAMIYANYRATVVELEEVLLDDYNESSEEVDNYFKEKLDYMAELLDKVRVEYNRK